ncbi:MAG: hypothetical protein WKG01_13070 [Kofleriaceae bacterium]
MVRRLDVVAELAAHQQHLVLEEHPPRAIVVALPPPAIARLVVPAWHAATRETTLATVAHEHGGGGGPLAILDLAKAPGGLTHRLAALEAQQIRRLIVHGARDQPGHARAVHARWHAELELLDSDLDGLLDPTVPTRTLTRGALCVAPGIPAPAHAAIVFAAVDADGDPRRVRDQGPQVWPYAVDRRRRLGPWSGVLPPEGLVGTADGARIRAAWDAYWTEQGHEDVVRAAALGLDPALEVDLREPGTPVRSARRARIIAITGIDGSGKSTQVARLASTLRDRGARVRVLKLYRQGAFLELANQLGARTRRGAPLAAFRVSRIVKLVDSLRVHRDHLAPALAECDAVIMDRYVETHVAAAESQLGWDLSRHPALAPFPVADLRCWLALDHEVALARREQRGGPPSADEHAVGLAGYARVFARLGAEELVLDAAVAEAENARAIAQRVTALVTSSDADPAASSLTPPTARSGAPGSLPCRVHLGDVGGERVELGREIFALRADLDRWCSVIARGIPEAFWLEAYAAQLVLDALTGARSAAIALWPGALARMTGHRDLAMLGELERMLESHVEVESFDPRADTYRSVFVALGSTAVSADRLAIDYAHQLRAIAGERGWRASIAAPSAAVS